MVFDDQQNDFLDNIIKNASNEYLIKMQQAGRQPASDVPNNIKPESMVTIEGSGDVNPIDVGDNYKYKNPTTPIFVENTNRALKQQQANVADMAANRNDSLDDLNKNKNQLRQVLSDLSNYKSSTPDTSELLSQMGKAAEGINAAKAPERNPLSEAILSFAPALFGAVSGEAGQLSQAASGQQARKQYEAGRAQDIQVAGAQNQAALNRYQSLAKLRDDIVNNGYKRDEMSINQKKAAIDGIKLLVGEGAKDVKTIEQAVDKANEYLAKSTQEGSKVAAQMEYKPTEEANKIKQAKIHSQASGDVKTLKRFDDFSKELDPDRARAGNFGAASAKVLQAQHLTALSDKLKQGQDLTPAEMEEYALGTANLISGGNGSSRSQVEALVPHSGVLDMNKILSYIQNNPRGAGQQKFVQQMHDSIERQQNVSQEQLNKIRVERLPNYSDLKSKDPQKYQSILDSKGIDTTRIDSKGRYIPKDVSAMSSQAVAHPEANSALDWANKNPNDPRAKEILKRLGH